VDELPFSKAEKLVILTLDEWYSDTASNIGMIYDVRLSVHDASGELIGETADQGEETVSGSAWEATPGKGRVPELFKAKVEELFNRDDIRNALET